LNINLALILTLLTAFTGAVVAFDRFYLRRRRDSADQGGQGWIIEYSHSFFPVLLFVLVIRSFIFEPFRIPSGSMMPTLLQGDYIFVKKYSYGLRLPVIEKKFIETGQPERGDVVVFRLPSEPNVNYIKRIIGLPGDEIVYSNHRLTVNGVPVPLQTDSAGDAPQVVAGPAAGGETRKKAVRHQEQRLAS
jgi:signal peptidase I